jgi:hypothetical protein
MIKEAFGLPASAMEFVAFHIQTVSISQKLKDHLHGRSVIPK